MRKENSTNYINEQQMLDGCPITTFFHRLRGRWKVKILWQLREGNKRFSEIKEALPGVSDRILSLQLDELQKDNFIVKNIRNDQAPMHFYQLTEQGKSMLPILRDVYDWGMKNFI